MRACMSNRTRSPARVRTHRGTGLRGTVTYVEKGGVKLNIRQILYVPSRVQLPNIRYATET